MEHVVIAGGSGLVGQRLSELLIKNNYHVIILTRSPKTGGSQKSYVYWDPGKHEIDEQPLEKVDHIVNLAGANLFSKRWTESYKKEIKKSRLQSTELLVDTFKQHEHLQNFVNASGVNYYGSQVTGVVDEQSENGSDFLAEVCKDWENALLESDLKATKIVLRFGIVMDAKDGALPQMMLPIKLGVGAPLGTGKEIMPWIHIDDLTSMIMFVLKNKNIEGVYNAVAPDPKSNEAITKSIASKLNKPLFMPKVPKFAIKLMQGEVANVILSSLNVSAEKIKKAGFQFQFPTIDKALDELLDHEKG